MDQRLQHAIRDFTRSERLLVVLTGAGISAESGIPTFRGPQGYWRVGSENYRPEDMATLRMFRASPEVVWQWYLYRLGVCRGAEPNAGHNAVVEMEKRFGDRFVLVTQNVDGLHLRAGNSRERTYQVHGGVDLMRCAAGCSGLLPLPDGVSPETKDEPPTQSAREALTCRRCAGWMRPHVLWFDECYDEEYYRAESSMRAAQLAGMLLVVGTSGATNLPLEVGRAAARRGALLVDVNPSANPFSEMARESGGFWLPAPAAEALPRIVDCM